jgi:hypothetical protein
MDTRKKILKLRYFSPLKILTSPFYLQRLLELLFSFLFFNTFFLSLSFQYFFLSLSLFNTFLSLSLSFSMLRLFEDLGILMINKEKNTLQKFLFR